jgi:pimeloyl-ACP methyl ester carboxylesterase
VTIDCESNFAVVLVHGFLDDKRVWDTVIPELRTPGVEAVELDLAGMGDRVDAGGPFTYKRSAADVGALVDGLGKTFVIVGQRAGANTTADVRPQSWTNAFASKSADAFGEAFADDVVLEGGTLTRPVKGRDRVMRVMGTASNIYESLVFTHEATAGLRSYLEWQATAFGGVVLDGVTILTTDARGRIVSAAIHHRPLDAALRFSAELGERLAGVLDSDYFYDRGASMPVQAGSR